MIRKSLTTFTIPDTIPAALSWHLPSRKGVHAFLIGLHAKIRRNIVATYAEVTMAITTDVAQNRYVLTPLTPPKMRLIWSRIPNFASNMAKQYMTCAAVVNYLKSAV